MPIFVTMTVKPPDGARFEKAFRESPMTGAPDEPRNMFCARSESDPGRYLLGGEWDSHDAMHRHTERVGADFNARAGTDGLEWETAIWEIKR